MRIPRATRIVYLVFFSFFLFVNPSKAAFNIIGKYINRSSPNDYIEFEKNGRFIAREEGISITGKWEAKNDEIRIYATVLGTDTVGRLKIKGNELLDEDGEVWIKQEEYEKIQTKKKLDLLNSKLDDVKKSFSELNNVYIRKNDLVQKLLNYLKPYLITEADTVKEINIRIIMYNEAETAQKKWEAIDQGNKYLSKLLPYLYDNKDIHNMKDTRDFIVQVEGVENRITKELNEHMDSCNNFENLLKSFPDKKALKTIEAEYQQLVIKWPLTPPKVKFATSRTLLPEMELKESNEEIDKLREEIKALQIVLADLESRTPQKNEISVILRKIQQTADESNLDITKFSPQGESDSGYYSEWPTIMEVAGSYDNLYGFFDKMSKFEKIVNIDDMSIKPAISQGPDKKLITTFMLKTFFFLEESKQILEKREEKKEELDQVSKLTANLLDNLKYQKKLDEKKIDLIKMQEEKQKGILRSFESANLR